MTLERAAIDWVSRFQRGFLKGRQMLRNVMEVDKTQRDYPAPISEGSLYRGDESESGARDYSRRVELVVSKAQSCADVADGPVHGK